MQTQTQTIEDLIQRAADTYTAQKQAEQDERLNAENEFVAKVLACLPEPFRPFVKKIKREYDSDPNFELTLPSCLPIRFTARGTHDTYIGGFSSNGTYFDTLSECVGYARTNYKPALEPVAPPIVVQTPYEKLRQQISVARDEFEANHYDFGNGLTQIVIATALVDIAETLFMSAPE